MMGRLQGLRAVAAYMVVLFHCFQYLHSTGMGIPRFPVGAAGVDLFFVISGFIMVHIAGQRETPAGFAISRIARIVPLYWAATLAAILVVAIRPWLFQTSLVNWQTVAASFAFIPAADATGAFTPILQVGWTLNWEMAFYLCFAVSLLAPRRFQLVSLIALTLVLFTAGLAAPKGSSATFYGRPIIFEFIAGSVLGWALHNADIAAWLKRLPAWPLVVVGALLLAAANFAPANVWMRPVVFGSPAALIVLGVVLLDLTHPRLKSGLLPRLGDASYSAYLLHPFFVAILPIVVTRFVGTNTLSAVIFVAVTLLMTAIASLLSYRFFEIPARNAVRQLYMVKRTQ